MHRSLLVTLGVLLGAFAASGQTPAAPAGADSARRLPPMVVTATRDSVPALMSPLPTATLTSADLRREHGVSLSQTVSRLPGIQSLSTGEQIGKPVIRGLTGARVLVLDDGLRLEDYSWSDEDGPSVDSRLANRVEVIRGPASVLYGSDALAGVINVIPAPLLDARVGGRIRHAQLEVYGASNALEGGGAFGFEQASGRYAARATFVGRLGMNVRTPAGEIRNTGYAAGNGDAAFGIHHDGGAETTLRFAHYGGEFQLLETDAPPGGTPSPDEGGPARISLDDRLQLVHQRPFHGVTVELRSQLQRHALAEKADDPNPAPGQPKETTVFDLVLNTATADLIAHHGPTTPDGLRGSIGVSGLFQQNDSRGIIPLVPDATTASGGLFAFERLGLGRLSLLAGARGDVRHLSAMADSRLSLADQTRSFGAVTADVGAVYQLHPALAVAVNAGRAWRAPSLFELYANGPRLGEGRYEYGNASLDPETSTNLDASLRWESARTRAELSAYRTRVQRFIYIAPTNTTQNNLRVYRYDQADAALHGLELSASTQATDALLLRGRVDGVRGSRVDDGDPLPLMPPVRAALGAEVRAAPGRFGRPYLGVDAEHVAAQTRLSREERDATVEPGRFPLATDAYTLLSLGGGFDVMARNRLTHVGLAIRNLTNVQYRDFLNRYKEFAYAPGFNAVVRLSTEF